MADPRSTIRRKPGKHLVHERAEAAVQRDLGRSRITRLLEPEHHLLEERVGVRRVTLPEALLDALGIDERNALHAERRDRSERPTQDRWTRQREYDDDVEGLGRLVAQIDLELDARPIEALNETVADGAPLQPHRQPITLLRAQHLAHVTTTPAFEANTRARIIHEVVVEEQDQIHACSEAARHARVS